MSLISDQLRLLRVLRNLDSESIKLMPQSTHCFSAGDEGLGRGEACDSGSSVTSAEQDRNVAALSQTCVMLQSQVRNSQDQASTSPVQVILKH